MLTRYCHHDGPRAATLALALLALACRADAQQTAESRAVVECEDEVTLSASPRFDPPAEGPLTFQWQTEAGEPLGTADTLTRRFPAGRHVVMVAVSTVGGRTSRTRIQIDARDTRPPVLRVGRRFVQVPADWRGEAIEVAGLAGVTARDACDPSPVLLAEAAGPFQPGQDTVVSVSATDAAGNGNAVNVTLRVAPMLPAEAGPPAVAGGPPVTIPLPATGPGPEPGTAPAVSDAPASAPSPGSTQPPDLRAQRRAQPTREEPPGAVGLNVGAPAVGWVVILSGGVLAAVGIWWLLAVLRRPRSKSRRAPVRARPIVDPGQQHVVLDDEWPVPVREMRVAPRRDAGAQVLDGDVVISEERHA